MLPTTLPLKKLDSRWHCDSYNLKSHRRCNNMSRMNFSGYVGHVTIFRWMFSIACCLVVGLGLGLDLLLVGRLLCTRICTAWGCRCHGPS